VEVTTAILPLAGALQRLAERVGRGSASVQILDGLRANRKLSKRILSFLFADKPAVDRIVNTSAFELSR